MIFNIKKVVYLLLLIPSLLFSQSEKLKGKVKSTREKLIFINDSIQNYKLLSYDGDYGHSGFISPKASIERFSQNWYNEDFVHYINNKRYYDKKGLLISEDWYDKKDRMIATFEYQYTEFDSITRIKEMNGYDNNYLITNISYIDKNIQSKLNYWSDDSQNFSLTLYYYNNFKKNKEQYLTEEGISYENYFYFNKDGLISKKIIHKPTVWSKFDSISYYQKMDSIGTFFCSTINKYNQKKELIEINTYTEPNYNSDSELYGKTYYKYDEKGNCIEEKTKYSYSEMIFLTRKKFDRKNRLIKELFSILNYSKESDWIKEYIYNNKDELKRLIIERNNTKTRVDFTYKYDSFNNWIEQIKYINNKKLFVWRREIDYYDK